MGTKTGQTVYADGTHSVVLTADEVLVGELVHTEDGRIVHHIISFSRAAWREIMSGSERELRQEQDR